MSTGILTIIAKLNDKVFKSQTKQMKSDLDMLSKNKSGGDTLGIGNSVGPSLKIAAIMALIAAVVAIIVKAFQQIKAENGETWKKIEQIRTSLSNLLNGVLTVLANLITPIIEFIVNLVYKLMSAINSVTQALFGVDLFAKSTSKSLASSSKSAKQMKKSLSGFDEINTIASPTSTGGTGGGVSTPEQASSGVSTAWEKIKEVLGNIWSWINTNVIQPVWKVIQPLVDEIVQIAIAAWDLIETVWDLVEPYFSSLWENIKTNFSTAWDFISNIFKIGWEFLKAGFENTIGAITLALDGIKTVIKVVSSILKGDFNGAWDAIKSHWSKAKTFFSDVWDNIKKAATNSWDAIKSAGKSVINFIIDCINKLIDGINKFLSPLRAIITGIGNLVGAKWTMDDIKIPKIPKLAMGGIVDLPRTGVNIGGAIAGEAGPEAVIPLSDNTLQRLANMIPITIDLTTELDGRVLNRRLEQVRNNNSFVRNGV